ncbi:hypothetical protein [uncultured Victivallis sp.]|uniref:hypothetical protein n=1 Tax=uncultured Victivallis sp. TaxID=354118 RepID=UPI0025DE7A4B|nr:hypothetical protein [uncultured Victivallis sp.]
MSCFICQFWNRNYLVWKTNPAIDSGRVFSQGAKLVEEAVTSKKLFAGDVWKKLVENVKLHDSTFTATSIT